MAQDQQYQATGTTRFWKVLTPSGLVSVLAGALVLISFFLPWYTISACCNFGDIGLSGFVSGFQLSRVSFLVWGCGCCPWRRSS